MGQRGRYILETRDVPDLFQPPDKVEVEKIRADLGADGVFADSDAECRKVVAKI